MASKAKKSKAGAKTSSKKSATLAGRVLAGYNPTRDEIETLAASVVAQSEKIDAIKAATKA